MVMTPRKKRYIIAAIIGSIAVSFALYNAAISFPYKTTKLWDFDQYQVNSLPDIFSAVQIGTGNPGKWAIVSDPSAPSPPNVLAKISVPRSGSDYSLLGISDSPTVGNARVSVMFKLISNATNDASAGLVIRLQDSSHYFVLMADSYNSRFSFCRADTGKILCTEDKNADIAIGQWHNITADVSTQGVAGYLDGTLLLQRYDAHYQDGQIGLWTKGDSQVYFDNLQIQY
jgi:hypothetical protein